MHAVVNYELMPNVIMKLIYLYSVNLMTKRVDEEKPCDDRASGANYILFTCKFELWPFDDHEHPS